MLVAWGLLGRKRNGGTRSSGDKGVFFSLDTRVGKRDLFSRIRNQQRNGALLRRPLAAAYAPALWERLPPWMNEALDPARIWSHPGVELIL